MSAGKRILLILIALIAAFGGGYLAAFLPAREAESKLQAAVTDAEAERARAAEELAKTATTMKLAALQVKLGQAYIAANERNFGIAMENMTPFFADMSELRTAPGLSEAQRKTLEGVLARRDELVSDLATANPDVKAKLSGIYTTLRKEISL